MIQLILSAPIPAMASAFDRAFKGMANATIHHGPFEALSSFDCMVSAANSFGLMDGGVDAAITAYFGTQLQKRVQQRILAEWLGEQPVGTAFVIDTGDHNHPWLVHAPTMRVPLIIGGTDAVYNATRAALLSIHRHNLSAGEDKKIRTVVFPAMGAGCGQVPPDSVAAQMKLAWLSVISPAQHISWQYANERQTAVFKSVAYYSSSTGCAHDHTKHIAHGDSIQAEEACNKVAHLLNERAHYQLIEVGAYSHYIQLGPYSHSHSIGGVKK